MENKTFSMCPVCENNADEVKKSRINVFDISAEVFICRSCHSMALDSKDYAAHIIKIALDDLVSSSRGKCTDGLPF